jgi:hypothetical protein
MEIDPAHLTQVSALPIIELTAVLIRLGQQLARVRCGEQFMGKTLKGRELIRATVGSSSGIMVSESHCRIPIASSIELMRAKRSSSER